MSESRTLSERYATIGAALIESDELLSHIRGSEATICYLSSDAAKKSNGKLVYGQCEKVADKNKWAIPADFLIVVYEPNCSGMDEEHLTRLIFHELLHVGIGEDRDGNEVYSIVPHDIEDFRACVGRWGVDWIRN